jgi:RHS repeat-associated protein
MAFGSIRTSTGTLPTDKKFTGQRLDSTGLYYYNARYYDPGIGRFISADTIVPNFADPQSLNRYSYCRNNPLRYIDPTGHWFETFLDIISLAVDVKELIGSPSWENAGYVGADLISLALPIVPAGGQIVKGIKNGVKTVNGVDKAAEGAKVIDKGLSFFGKAEELGVIERHLSKMDHAIENDAMIQRIGVKIEKGESLTGADANFYKHELYENELMNNGMKYEDAHAGALDKYNVCEWDLYDPSAVKAADEANGGWRSLNDSYYDYWGIQ